MRFFDRHTLRSEYNPGHVRLALDIVKTLRPREPLCGDEEKLLSRLDPRALKSTVKPDCVQSQNMVYEI